MDLINPTRDQFVEFPEDEPPRLMVCIDAEEEFDWNAPLPHNPYSVRSMDYIWRTQSIFDSVGLRPTYVVDYPVAKDKRVAETLGALSARGSCVIGAHLHPWVNPPFEEELSNRASFPGNLAGDLEKRKLHALTDLIEETLKQRPVIYKAGRYGIGPATANALEDLDYKIDMSVVPRRNYAFVEGPDFSHLSSTPYWFGRRGDMLEIPFTGGYTGMLRSAGARSGAKLYSPKPTRAHIPGLFARAGLLNRIYITPEGTRVSESKRLTRILLDSGCRIFTLHFHSPSLVPGNTPYVRSGADLSKFLSWLQIYLDFFFIDIGGVATTPMQIYERAIALRQGPRVEAKTATPISIRSPAPREAHAVSASGAAKCLLVTSNFPPVRGGSAVVYSNLCRHAPQAMEVLTAWRSYATSREVAGWREHDEAAGFPITRVELLRPIDPTDRWPIPISLSFFKNDLPIMWRVFRQVRSIVQEHGIKIICIGELVHGGWLAFVAHRFLGCKVIQYIHGEEITVQGRSVAERLRRAYGARADALVAVSGFTKDVLVNSLGLSPEKIVLIENGVDATRFREMAASPQLVERLGIAGKRVILSVGRLIERKGFDRALQALPEVLRSHPDVHYLVVGEGPYHARLEEMVLELGLGGSVTFAGDVPDVELADYYALCDFFVLPNREMPNGDTEGFGLVYLEANASGKPVISGQAGGVLEAVRDGVNGLTVDGTDPAAIAKAMVRLLDDRDLYERLRVGGLSVAQQSSWEQRAEQFDRLCAGLVEGANTASKVFAVNVR